VLLSTPDDPIAGDDGPVDYADEDVIAAAEALATELAAAQAESTTAEIDSLLMRCTEEISDETGVDYGRACGAGGSC